MEDLRCCHGGMSAKCTERNQLIYPDILSEAFCAPPVKNWYSLEWGLLLARVLRILLLTSQIDQKMEAQISPPNQGEQLSSSKLDSNLNQTKKSPFTIRNSSKIQPIGTFRGKSSSKVTKVPTIRIAPQKAFKDRLLDAIYFLCPDCSYIQCFTIFLGLLAAAALTVILLFAGGYWSKPARNTTNIEK